MEPLERNSFPDANIAPANKPDQKNDIRQNYENQKSKDKGNCPKYQNNQLECLTVMPKLRTAAKHRFAKK